MSTNGTQSGAPDLGKAQLAFLGWLEPVVSTPHVPSQKCVKMPADLYIDRSGNDGNFTLHKSAQRLPHLVT